MTTESSAMRELMVRPSVREVLACVSGGSALTPPAEEAARAALARVNAARMPWYLRVLIAAGAWWGAGFFMSSILSLILMAAGEQRDDVAIVIGILLLVGSILLRRRVKGTFGMQVSLVISSTGQILVIGGVGEMTSSLTAGCIAAIVSSIVLIVWFPDRLQRFCATLVIFGAIATYGVDQRIAYGPDAMAVTLLVLILALWRFAPREFVEEHAEIVDPVISGLVASLLIVLVTHTVVSMADIRDMLWMRLSVNTMRAFTLALLAFVISLFVEHRLTLSYAKGYFAVASLMTIVVVGALTRDTPGIVATILLLLLGFDRRSRILIALATAFFIGFVAAFYYDARLTLLEKSGILVSVGIIILGWGFSMWNGRKYGSL